MANLLPINSNGPAHWIDSDSDEEKVESGDLAQQSLPTLLEELHKSLNAIDFYPHFEDEDHSVIPVEVFAPFAANLNHLQKIYRDSDWKNVQPFFEQLKKVLLQNALKSRTAQLKKYEASEGQEAEFQRAAAQEHLNRLQDPQRHHYLEMLAQLLNLRQFSQYNREPTMREQQAFRFISRIIESRHPQDAS